MPHQSALDLSAGIPLAWTTAGKVRGAFILGCESLGGGAPTLLDDGYEGYVIASEKWRQNAAAILGDKGVVLGICGFATSFDAASAIEGRLLSFDASLDKLSSVWRKFIAKAATHSALPIAPVCWSSGNVATLSGLKGAPPPSPGSWTGAFVRWEYFPGVNATTTVPKKYAQRIKDTRKILGIEESLEVAVAVGAVCQSDGGQLNNDPKNCKEELTVVWPSSAGVRVLGRVKPESIVEAFPPGFVWKGSDGSVLASRVMPPLPPKAFQALKGDPGLSWPSPPSPGPCKIDYAHVKALVVNEEERTVERRWISYCVQQGDSVKKSGENPDAALVRIFSSPLPSESPKNP